MIFLFLFITIAMNHSVIAGYFTHDAVAQSTDKHVYDINQESKLGKVAGVEEITNTPRRVYTTKSIGVVLSAPTSLVIDVSTGNILWEHNADKIVPIASISKLASVATLLDRGLVLDDVVTMKSQDQRPEGGNRHLYLGEKVTVDNLLHTVLIASDNEALMALVRYSGLSEEEFVNNVNDWADKHDLKTLHIEDPTGLNKNNVASARDVASLAKIVFANKLVSNIAKKSTYNFTIQNTKRVVKLKSTNQLLTSPFNVLVGKTGFIDQAGYCLVTKSLIKNSHEIITVVLGSDSITNRFQDTKALLYWIDENYRW